MAGYYIFFEEENLDRLKNNRIFAGIVFAVSDIATMYMFIWEDNSGFACYVLCRIAEWFGILFIIPLARQFFNANNRLTAYFTRRSFLIYIFHFVWLVAAQFYMNRITTNIVILYVVPVIAAFVLTLITVEIVHALSTYSRLHR